MNIASSLKSMTHGNYMYKLGLFYLVIDKRVEIQDHHLGLRFPLSVQIQLQPCSFNFRPSSYKSATISFSLPCSSVPGNVALQTNTERLHS